MLTNRWGVVVSVSNISCSPSLNHLQSMDVILLVWIPYWASILQGRSYEGHIRFFFDRFVGDVYVPFKKTETGDYWWCISWRTTSHELIHQASLYQMNDPPETTMSRHCAFHHARPQYGRIRSILEWSRNGTPCLTVLSLPWVLNPSRLSSVIKLK
jgi:hypothetical protein